jgi:hypothetical protein
MKDMFTEESPQDRKRLLERASGQMSQTEADINADRIRRGEHPRGPRSHLRGILSAADRVRGVCGRSLGDIPSP